MRASTGGVRIVVEAGRPGHARGDRGPARDPPRRESSAATTSGAPQRERLRCASAFATSSAWRFASPRTGATGTMNSTGTASVPRVQPLEERVLPVGPDAAPERGHRPALDRVLSRVALAVALERELLPGVGNSASASACLRTTTRWCKAQRRSVPQPGERGTTGRFASNGAVAKWRSIACAPAKSSPCISLPSAAAIVTPTDRRPQRRTVRRRPGGTRGSRRAARRTRRRPSRSPWPRRSGASGSAPRRSDASSQSRRARWRASPAQRSPFEAITNSVVRGRAARARIERDRVDVRDERDARPARGGIGRAPRRRGGVRGPSRRCPVHDVPDRFAAGPSTPSATRIRRPTGRRSRIARMSRAQVGAVDGERRSRRVAAAPGAGPAAPR